LLSRCQVLILRRLDHRALEVLIERAEAEVGRPLRCPTRRARR
jgi:putative ATPase